MIERLLVDTSAWHRSGSAAVADAWADRLAADELMICPQVRLEILYSARSAGDYEAIASELDALRRIGTGDAAFDGQVGQERHHLGGTQIARMTLVVKNDEALDPIHVGMFSAEAVMFKPDFIPDLIQ